ncbi:hypothetical protein CBR_g18744 [Chara braunii]|uniref:glucose-6-phosphate dehydrogenase (NADP(+)) n=1 Tax=Chara braunii TaxID=69332 RepID=A0A388KWJ9_CHABU|nr:hypothetical protein CBR_g18744 [Chara braunii]|eukprot:GBG74333.1 hypothetical protein CBR_g18744 [Chara braunii]
MVAESDAGQSVLTCALPQLGPSRCSAQQGDEDGVHHSQVLKCVEPIRLDEVVVGQYEGYTDDPTVPPGSKTPTFASVILRINNERWDGVPFIMKAGKALNERKAEIRLQFRDVPGDIFRFTEGLAFCMDAAVEWVLPPVLDLIDLKSPGLEMSTTQSELDLSYRQRYQNVKIPEAYERLILDVIKGEPSNFVRRDELRVAWEIFTPLLQLVDGGKFHVIPYSPGSRGPKEADDMAEKAGYQRFTGYVWHPPSLSAI